MNPELQEILNQLTAKIKELTMTYNSAPDRKKINQIISTLKALSFMEELPDPTVEPSLPRLEISEDKRYLTKNGKRFIYISDTHWNMLEHYTPAQIDKVLEVRKAQGFDGIMTMLGGMDTEYYPRPAIRPYDDSYYSLNKCDYIANKTEELRLYFMLVPICGRHIKSDEPVTRDTNIAYRYGKRLGKRFKDKDHIIWIAGGDERPGKNVLFHNQLMRGVREAGATQLASFHPEGSTTSAPYNNGSWLDFNMFQTWQWVDKLEYLIKKCYDLSPTRPFMNGEPAYENGGYNFPKPVDAKFILWQACTTILKGGCGFCYGTIPTWGKYDEDALYLEGAKKMKMIKNLI